MDRINVGRYSPESSTSHGYAGWIEPSDRSWIMFVRNDRSVEVFLDRDSATGAVA